MYLTGLFLGNSSLKQGRFRAFMFQNEIPILGFDFKMKFQLTIPRSLHSHRATRVASLRSAMRNFPRRVANAPLLGKLLIYIIYYI